MRREANQCRWCGRRSERVSLGLSCFHCGHKPTDIRFTWIILTIAISATIGSVIARCMV